MAPKRKSKRADQLHPQPAQQSDYDTDTANTTDAAIAANAAAALMPPIPARSITELNLKVLQRYYPAIASIASVAPFAVVYQYNPHSAAWEKIGVEGTGFVCELAGEEEFAVVVLNRKSLDNFAIDLDRVAPDDIEITAEYVIVPVVADDEAATPIVYGLWIFSDETQAATVKRTRQIVADKIVECAARAAQARARGRGRQEENTAGTVPEYNLDGDAAPAVTTPQVSMQPQSTGQQIDLSSLFTRGPAPTPQSVVSYSTAPDQYPPPPQQGAQQAQQLPSQPPQFSGTSDTDFFRGPPRHAVAQPGPVPVQQNSLLDLFRNAGNG